jgi:BMFP domain-containing protein YqiC
MTIDSRLLDDFARLFSGAMGTAQGARRELEALFYRQVERALAKMDVVGRDEFEAVKAMAAKAREDQEALLERLARLEAMLATREPPP